MEEKNLIYVNADDDLKAVLTCFKVNRISHVPVTIENKIVGMISKTDVVEYLHDRHEEYTTKSFEEALTSIKAKELMIQPLIEAKDTDTEQFLLEKLMDLNISSVVIRDSKGDISGIVTDKDMLKFLASRVEKDMSFTEKLSLHIIQWLNQNGIIRISKALGDIGI